MRSIETTFGENAERIWKALEETSPLDKKKLLKTTKLNEKEFYVALGWLARENKIYRDTSEKFRLGETNLTAEIGSNAGKIWKIMDIWGEVNVTAMKRLAEIEEHAVYSALGWLARENKIYQNENGLFHLK